MKKSKKFLLSMCTGALATVMVMGNSGVVALAESAKAENVEKSISEVNGINYSTVEFGEEIVIPKPGIDYEVKVIDPKGNVLVEDNGLAFNSEDSTLSCTANKIGHYTVVIYKNGENEVEYSYDVLCNSSREYKLDIADTDIPSFLGINDNRVLPKAKVYYEEDGEKVYVQKDGADLEIAPVITGVEDVENYAKKNATAYVTYKYETGSGVYVDAQYKILIQDNFEDKVKPSLSVGSYSESANLNIKYTLPTATATDAYDERVKVVITVTDDEGKAVLKAVVDDKTGYAVGTEDVEAEFDNLDNMSFYPTKTGDYTVTYKAVDDSGNESDPLSYVLTVKDQKGPTISVDRSSIPEKWAYGKVYYEAEDGEEVKKDDLKIYLPVPEYYDNNNTARLEVALTLKDPEGNQIAKVTSIENLNADEPSSPVVSNSDIGDFVSESSKDGVAAEFDIAGYVAAVINKIESKDLKSEYKYAGSYTVQYTVKDTVTQSTTSSQTYTINVSENYNDDSEIGITASAEVVKNVVLSEGDTFKLPTFVINSSNDGYLKKSYTLKIGDVTMDFTDFEGGEEIKLIQEDDKYFLSYEDSTLEVQSGDVLSYEIYAEADSGRTALNTEKSTEIVIPEIRANSYTVTANGDLSEILIGVPAEENKYVGVEMGLKSSDGEYVSFDATVYYNPITQCKVIKDIEYITPNEDGTYYLEVKVYDIYGTNQVSVFKLDLKAGKGEDNWESEESAFATSTTVGTSISWNHSTFNTGDTFGDDVDRLMTAHKISGGRFSWMGSEFTPLQANTYTLVDTVVPLDENGNIVSAYDDQIAAMYEMRSEVVATASTSKTIVLDTAMPSYLANTKESINSIPSAVIYDASKNYDYTMRLTNPNGVASNYKSYQDMIDNASFTSDGNYTVAYLVNGSVVKSYTIKVGDVTPVSFTVENTVNDAVITKNSGYVFTFDKVIVSESDSEDISKFTFKKVIRDASGNIVGKEYEKTGENGANEKGSAVTLTETGTYTVTYTVVDQSGNESYKKVTIKITSSATTQDIDYTTLSTIIIIVVCLGIAGIIVYYVVSSRKKNKKKNN